jgi:2',3'-cyclic-nucleotide 2'-phosphodiesterase (5'-nucleotidase family)
MVAYPRLIQINVPGSTGDYSLLLSNNHSTGGTCFGDSGGPNFLRDSNIIAAVTSFSKNGNCAGTGGAFRMDRQDVLDFVNPFLVDPILVIGETTSAITRDYRYEASMGDWVTDIMRAYDLGIDFALYNSGGLRADIDVGQITLGEVFAVLPFGNTLVVVELDGDEVLQVLEEGITDAHGVVQVSGLQFYFDYDEPEGQRIIGDVIDLNTGQPIVPSKIYSVAVNSFMASGGDGYTTLSENPQYDTYVPVYDIVVDWAKANSPFAPPDPAVEQRITAYGTIP